MVPVKITSPGSVPITTDAPSKVSFNITDGLLSPMVNGDFVKSSIVATNSPTTKTITVAVVQFAGFAPLSQISYSTS